MALVVLGYNAVRFVFAYNFTKPNYNEFMRYSLGLHLCKCVGFD